MDGSVDWTLENNFTISGKLKDALSLQFIKSTCKYIYTRVIYGHKYQVTCTWFIAPMFSKAKNMKLSKYLLTGDW